MTHASVFSGIGGPEVAAAMLGWENLFHCEINPFGRKVLQYWFPNSESYEDVTKTDFSKWRGKVDVLSGGFPCQPFSYAGKRRGTQDDRFLWPHMLRVIQEVRPTWVIGENVNGIRTDVEPGVQVEVGSEADLFGESDRVYGYRQESTFTIEQICRNFESVGYSVQPFVIPACSVGAPHRRERVFFVAHRNDAGTENLRQGGKDTLRELGAFANAYCGGGREIHEHLQSQFANGNEPVSLGRIRNAADTESESAARHKSGQREAGAKKQGKLGRGRCENGSDENTSDTDCKGLERSDNAGRGEAEYGDGIRGNAAGCNRQDSEIDGGGYKTTTDCNSNGLQGFIRTGQNGIEEIQRQGVQADNDSADYPHPNWDLLKSEERWRDFPTVSPVHRGNDGLPFPVDRLTIPFSQWRTESIKAYGNAIVPQVMYEIFRAIQEVENK